VTLIGACKTQGPLVLQEAIAAGLVDFGENRVQEAMEKWPALKKQHPHIQLHLIGPLQSNKAADAVALFDVIHTIDRPKIADAVADQAKKQGRILTCLIQLNTGQEPQKGGIAPRELPTLLAHCQNVGLPIEGLMCVPPVAANAAPHFALLQKMARGAGLSWLSMGMSDDFELAIRFGATHVRIGTALFGQRSEPNA
jgi:pyridoxal phosphate enzyme (YggS family)